METSRRGRKSLSGDGDSPQIRIRISDLEKQALTTRATQSGATVSEYVRSILRRELASWHLPPEVHVQIELHRQVIPALIADPDGVRRIARENIAAQRQRRQSPQSTAWLDEWEALLDGPPEKLIAVFVAHDEHSIDLRQVGPFAGVLTDAQRVAAIHSGRALAKI